MTSPYIAPTTYVDEGSSVTIDLDYGNRWNYARGPKETVYWEGWGETNIYHRYQPGDVVTEYLPPNSLFDFNTPGNTKISATLDDSLKAAFTFNAIADNITEGPERFTFYVDEEYIFPHYIIINDTSKNPVLVLERSSNAAVEGSNNVTNIINNAAVEGSNNVTNIINNTFTDLRVRLSENDDRLTGQSDLNLAMRGGDDFLEVVDGFENFANGNMGDDQIILRGGQGRYLGGRGKDKLEVFNTLPGSWVNGNQGDDIIYGIVKETTYRGGVDNDILSVQRGSAWGDDGLDTFVGLEGAGYVRIFDYTPGEDKVQLGMDGSWSQVDDGLAFTKTGGDRIMLLSGIDSIEEVTTI